MEQLNVNNSIEEWHRKILQSAEGNDIIFFSEDISDSICFSTNYMQFLSRSGNCEVVPLYGRLISDLETFIYQVNCSLPVGYKLKVDNHALYDLLLNFETEPLRRVIFWNDADFLFTNNSNHFDPIFESLVVSAYCNRNAISTIKEDGSKYIVDQRNLFFFNGLSLDHIAYLLQKKYYIPSIEESETQTYSNIDFTIIELVS
jgi:hypothetical protein